VNSSEPRPDSSLAPDITIVRELLAAGEGFVSGERLAEALGMSRVAVWSHIEKLRSFGFTVEAVRRKGYRLAARPTRLDPILLAALSSARHAPAEFALLDEVDSTNSEAERRLAGGAPTPLVVVSRIQTRGRGRLGRRWESTDCGNLYVSFAFRPRLRPQRMQDFTLWMGVNVCEALAASCRFDAGVKWPNDILHAGRKLGGMLTEARIDADSTRDVVFGLGLNINSQRSDWPPEIAPRTTSVAEATGRKVDLNRVSAAVIARVLAAYERFVEGDHRADFERLWARFDLLRDRRIAVLVGDERIEGVAEGLDPVGALRLRDDQGRVHRCLAGDVTIEKAPL
jgi:BirA family biotin operon repressor/biotin-[acetyl-CoA-carboxylase] ligase